MFPEQEEGKWIAPVMHDYQTECCECGLKHSLDFRVVRILKVHKDGTKTAETCGNEYQVEFRAYQVEEKK